MDEEIRNTADGPAGESPGGPPQASREAGAGAADRSLAHALRVSFRVLTVIMIFIVGAFLLTGIKSIDATEQGIIFLFGEIVGTADSGFVYTWPFPIGAIEKVKTTEKTLTISECFFVPP